MSWLRVFLLAGAIAFLVLLTRGDLGRPDAPAVLAAPAAPQLISPPEGETLTSFGPRLEWVNPLQADGRPGATQVQLQVVPFNNDGPGVDLHTSFQDFYQVFQVSPPPGWYGLLPDMTYTWRVRGSDAPGPISLADPSWGPWAERRFRTPAVTSATIGWVAPRHGCPVSTRTPLLQWADSRGDVFYYEVQVSRDPNFGGGPSGPWAAVYWELRHGGATSPPNSYAVPQGFPLQDNTSYYWRVRPRVQGDGTSVAWSATWSFNTATAAGPPTPTPTPIATPRPSGAGGRIAFTSERDGNSEIYVVNVDDGGQTNLTNYPGGDANPRWSPDGSKIAFQTMRDSGFQDIYVMNADGGGQTNLTNNSGGLNIEPWWSPDGSKIAFESGRDRGGGHEIYVMNADGCGQTRLTNSPRTDYIPQWSPDGSKIAFLSILEGSGSYEIYVVSADGSGQTNFSVNSAFARLPHWSPDGSKIAFVSTRDGNQEIYVMNADGSGQTRLTNDPAIDYSPQWSPDGSKIAFVSLRDGTVEIYVMNADGGGQTRLTNDPASGLDPKWSPDGSKIAFASARDGNYEIYVMNADGSGQTNLTNNPARDTSPRWSPE